MNAMYLRIKNFGDFQHYDPRLRTPPWIKQYVGLLDDLDFLRLDEFTQWQLARVWLVAARSSSLTLDEKQRVVPVVANDAQSLQRAISSTRRVPLARLICEGWLIPVDEDDLLTVEEIAAAPPRSRQRASKGDNTGDNKGASGSLRSREAEVSEVLDQSSGRQSPPGRLNAELAEAIAQARAATESLPIELEFQVGRLMWLIGDHADTGTQHVVEAYARRLPQASLAKVIESLELNEPRDRAAYAVGALRGEVEEREVA